MKLDLVASIAVSLAVHAGAAVMVGGWLSNLPAGAPIEVPGLEEVTFEMVGGEETPAEEAKVSAEPAEPVTEVRIAAAPPVEKEDAPPAPKLEEQPRAIGPVQEAATVVKTSVETPAREPVRKPAGNLAVKQRGSTPRGFAGGTSIANYRSRASLSYPASAMRERVGGRVVLLVSVDENGRATDVSVKQSSGRADLDAAAMACARQSSYEPYRANGVPQTSRVEAPFEFKVPGR
jgi:protein TonB